MGNIFRAAESSLSRHLAVGRRRWWLRGSHLVCLSCLGRALAHHASASAAETALPVAGVVRVTCAWTSVTHTPRALSRFPHIPTYAVSSASLASAALTVTLGRLDDAGRAGGGTRISGDI